LVTIHDSSTTNVLIYNSLPTPIAHPLFEEKALEEEADRPPLVVEGPPLPVANVVEGPPLFVSDVVKWPSPSMVDVVAALDPPLVVEEGRALDPPL
jgi:hypothetical protein